MPSGSNESHVSPDDDASSRTFMWKSLRSRNYRNYLAGHGLSNAGMWMQQTAEVWLIMQLTGLGTAVGMHSVLRFGPVLLFGTFGGLLSDRLPRRTLLIVTQSLYAIGAVIITIAVWRGTPSLGLVYGIILGQGLVTAVDNPLRRAFVRDLVPDEDLSNAISLNSSVATMTRAVGPAAAGLLIAKVGVAWCFAINSFSYAAVLIVLVTLDRSKLRPQKLAQRAPRQVREGVAFARKDAGIRDALLLCLAAGTFAWNWTVLMPFYVTEEFGGDAALFGLLLSTLSCGAVLGALATARLRKFTRQHLNRAATALSVSLMMTAVAPTLPLAAMSLVALGATSTMLVVGAQARIQLRVTDLMSGRVLALFTVVFVGSKPFGGIIGGWVTEVAGARAAFATGGLVMAAASALLWAAARVRRRRIS